MKELAKERGFNFFVVFSSLVVCTFNFIMDFIVLILQFVGIGIIFLSIEISKFAHKVLDRKEVFNDYVIENYKDHFSDFFDRRKFKTKNKHEK